MKYWFLSWICWLFKHKVKYPSYQAGWRSYRFNASKHYTRIQCLRCEGVFRIPYDQGWTCGEINGEIEDPFLLEGQYRF